MSSKKRPRSDLSNQGRRRLQQVDNPIGQAFLALHDVEFAFLGDGIGMTRRAGLPEAMKLERDYVNALQVVTSHGIEEKQLVLENGDEVKLVFKAATEKEE